jgi:hypothetical protein
MLQQNEEDAYIQQRDVIRRNTGYATLCGERRVWANRTLLFPIYSLVVQCALVIERSLSRPRRCIVQRRHYGKC